MIQLLKMAFGPDPMAMQSIAIVGIIVVFGMLLYQLNVTVTLPSINIQYKDKDQVPS